MKLKIFIFGYETPSLLAYQAETFKKFLKCPYEVFLIDDSMTDRAKSAYVFVCNEYGIHRIPTNKKVSVKGRWGWGTDPSGDHQVAMQGAFDNMIYGSSIGECGNCMDDVVLLLDHDCCLIKEWNPLVFMKDKEIAAVMAVHDGGLDYLWPGLTLLNMSKIGQCIPHICMSGGEVYGKMTDSGGQSAVFIKDNGISVHKFNTEILCHTVKVIGGNPIEANLELFDNGRWVHIRGAGHEMSNAWPNAGMSEALPRNSAKYIVFDMVVREALGLL
jgi:hypothetical protein